MLHQKIRQIFICLWFVGGCAKPAVQMAQNNRVAESVISPCHATAEQKGIRQIVEVILCSWSV